MRTLLQTILMLLLTVVIRAQEVPAAVTAAKAPENPLTSNSRYMFAVLHKVLLQTADKMPAENYDFRPAETVRTFGQLIGHVADSNHRFCSVVLGEAPAPLNAEKSKSTKEDLVAALGQALKQCERAHASVNDASAADMVKFGRDTPKLGVLTSNLIHSTEHYGNLVTYMRMKGLVPPTSEPDFLKTLPRP